MPVSLTGVVVTIASPGDALAERAQVTTEMLAWTTSTGRRQGVALLPWLWERHAIPVLGNRPQMLINAQAVDRSDVVVAFFDSRLGTSTGVDVSGTAEEIFRAHEQGKPVHVYFSTEPLPRDVDIAQLKAMNAFRARLQKIGLLGEYDDPRDLAAQVVRAIEHDIAEKDWGATPVAASAAEVGSARLRWSHLHSKEQKGVDRRGRMLYRTTTNRLVVRNDGDVAAQDMTVQVEGLGGIDMRFDGPSEPVTLQPDSELSWLLIPLGRGSVRVDASWREGDHSREANWTVTVPGAAV